MTKTRSEPFPEDTSGGRELSGIHIYWLGDENKDSCTQDAILYCEPNIDQGKDIPLPLLRKAERKAALIAEYFHKKLKEEGHDIDVDIEQDPDGFHFAVFFGESSNNETQAQLVEKFQSDLDTIYYQIKDTPALYDPERATQEAFTNSKLDLYKDINDILGGNADQAQQIMSAVQRHVYPDKQEQPKPPSLP